MPRVPHELPPEIQIRLVLIVGPAAQRDIVRPVLSAFPIGPVVMVLHRARASAATTLLIDERAATTVAPPYLASDRGRNGARLSNATPIVRSLATSIAAARLVGNRSLRLERFVE